MKVNDFAVKIVKANKGTVGNRANLAQTLENLKNANKLLEGSLYKAIHALPKK